MIPMVVDINAVQIKPDDNKWIKSPIGRWQKTQPGVYVVKRFHLPTGNWVFDYMDRGMLKMIAGHNITDAQLDE